MNQLTITDEDRSFFQLALRLARRGLGRVAPNPAVGCVLVKNGRILGRGWTQPSGRPHAEVHALSNVAPQCNVEGATAYVTLEPCSHTGQTGPCADALIQAGIGRVVVGPTDPDMRVSGNGLAKMQDAGLYVVTMDGAEFDLASDLNLGFFLTKTIGRPLVGLKLATTLDGKLATHTGSSKWVTGDLARQDVHQVRSEFDAIMVGSRTAILDNPSLTVRTPGLEHSSPTRVILDGTLRVPLTHKVIATAHAHKTVVFTSVDSDPERIKVLRQAHVDVFQVTKTSSGLLDVKSILSHLAEMGQTRVMVEGGSRLAASLLDAELVDQIFWYRAGKLVGNDGLSAIGALGIQDMNQAIQLDLKQRRPVGDDVVEEFLVRYQ